MNTKCHWYEILMEVLAENLTVQLVERCVMTESTIISLVNFHPSTLNVHINTLVVLTFTYLTLIVLLINPTSDTVFYNSQQARGNKTKIKIYR